MALRMCFFLTKPVHYGTFLPTPQKNPIDCLTVLELYNFMDTLTLVSRHGSGIRATTMPRASRQGHMMNWCYGLMQ